MITSQAVSKKDKENIYKLRHRVFCEEKKYLNPEPTMGGLEYDEFDRHSVHYMTLNTNGEVIGTVRLVLDSPLGFPVNRHFEIPHGDRSIHMAEVSRLAVCKSVSNMKHTVMLHLCKAIYDYSIENGIIYWYAILDEPVLRLMLRLGFVFNKIGEGKYCFGDVTSPYLLSLEETMARLEVYKPRIHQFFAQPKHAIKATI